MASVGGLSSGMAMSAHQDVLDATPDAPEAKLRLLDEIKNRARSAIAIQNYKDAEVLYKKGLTLVEDPKQEAILHANLSLVERNMGLLGEARLSAQKATELDPTYVKGYWRLGQALSSLESTQEALDAMQQASKLEPKNKALLKECEKLKQKLEHEKEKKTNDDDDDLMDIAAPPPVKPLEKPVKKKTATATTKPAPSKPSKVVDDEDGGFKKSDHVKGYKVVNGKKTSYFHNELSEKDKALIGDIAPKKLDATPQPATAPTEGASAWNKAGTWEERDVTAWAKDTLKASLLGTTYTLPDSSPDPGAVASISSVSSCDGHASYATVRGKKRYIYEFSVKLNWKLDLSADECSGTMTFPDIDGTCELGDGYDLVEYTVHADSPSSAKPLLDRFVKSGGLRDSIHQCIDDWVRLFRSTY